MSTANAAIVGDLLRGALDDIGIKLRPLVERELVARMVELADLAGVEMVIARTEPGDIS